MATNEVCKLMISLNVLPWCSEPREYEIVTGSLSKIDNYTLEYKNQDELFMSIKDELFIKLNDTFIREIGLVPIDLTLGDVGVFVRKPDKDIKALFKTITLDEREYPLKSLAIHWMSKGSLKAFYECDKKRSDDHEYQSFFKEKLRYVAERLEVDALRNTDYAYVYDEVISKKRGIEALRFFLMDSQKYSFDEIYQMFLRDISKYENIPPYHSAFSYEDDKETKYYYRYPYKDD